VLPVLAVEKISKSLPDEVSVGAVFAGHLTEEGKETVYAPPFVNSITKELSLETGTPVNTNVVVPAGVQTK
jgi:hypothetical protein